MSNQSFSFAGIRSIHLGMSGHLCALVASGVGESLIQRKYVSKLSAAIVCRENLNVAFGWNAGFCSNGVDGGFYFGNVILWQKACLCRDIEAGVLRAVRYW